MNVIDIPLSEIHVDQTWNCRGKVAKHSIRSLAEEIARDGLLQPVVVRPATAKPYQLVAGFRRYLAFQSLGRETIPANVREDLTDQQARVINLKENVERQNLNILQEANALIPFKGWSIRRIAQELNVYQAWVDIRLKLLELEPELQAQAAAGLIPATMIPKLWAAEDRRKIAREHIEGKLFGEPTKQRIDPYKRKPQSQASLKRMLEHVQSQVAGSLVERALAWATGGIDEMDLHRSVQEIFPAYRLPEYQ